MVGRNHPGSTSPAIAERLCECCSLSAVLPSPSSPSAVSESRKPRSSSVPLILAQKAQFGLVTNPHQKHRQPHQSLPQGAHLQGVRPNSRRTGESLIFYEGNYDFAQFLSVPTQEVSRCHCLCYSRKPDDVPIVDISVIEAIKTEGAPLFKIAKGYKNIGSKFQGSGGLDRLICFKKCKQPSRREPPREEV